MSVWFMNGSQINCYYCHFSIWPTWSTGLVPEGNGQTKEKDGLSSGSVNQMAMKHTDRQCVCTRVVSTHTNTFQFKNNAKSECAVRQRQRDVGRGGERRRTVIIRLRAYWPNPIFVISSLCVVALAMLILCECVCGFDVFAATFYGNKKANK